jgi:hypothetical protein
MELRFPLDMGILIITCPNCSHSFRMDPDDPRTYQSGSFDLSPPKKTTLRVPFVNSISTYLQSSKDIKFLIPIFLLLVLLLNILKIYNTAPEKGDTEKEIQEFYPDPDQDIPAPENKRIIDKPSVEI